MDAQRQYLSRDSSLAAAVVAGLTLARILGLFLTDLNLYGDEAQYWTWAQDLAFGYFSKPPMIAWLIAATTEVCGNGEACVRLSSPLLHAGACLVLFLAARELYDSRTALWSAILYATLPGVSFSSFLISTDVPLLFFWAAALLAMVRLRSGGGLAWAAVLGVALGLGTLSKYAMLYFVACLVLAAVFDRPLRAGIVGRNGLVALVLAALLIAPNVVWNMRHGWATVGHTADNADWEAAPIHFGSLLDFTASQFGLAGPLVFAAFLVAAVLALRPRARSEDRLMALFSLPVLLGMLGQALASRAHANWAATAYPAAVVLLAACFAAPGWRWVRSVSVALHGVAAVLLVLVVTGAVGMPGFIKADPFARVRGWDELGRDVARKLQSGQYSGVLVEERMLAASLKYYLPERDVPVVVWGRNGPPRNHYELTSMINRETGRNVLFVTRLKRPEGILSRFQAARDAGEVSIKAGPRRILHFNFYELDGFEGF